ncbi:MAG: peptide-methionine (S)-S-oxide reductase MsrA [Acidimicrobiia bacterium]|nr:peptide-methionine (S)-S-oxide reductase MsrA [Acidimicrobiia bacterium]
MIFGRNKKSDMPAPEDALPGRDTAVEVPERHYVLGTPLTGPWPDGTEQAMFGMGCFWGAERIFWQIDGVYSTAVGYAGGYTPNPSYQEVCTGRTGHNEVAFVVYDPTKAGYDELLRQFWEQHDPTTLNRQGNDVGTQYRSGIYYDTDEQRERAKQSQDRYQQSLSESGFGPITTEILSTPEWYYAEDYHQQYLAKNPGGYCNHGFCQVSYS